MFPLGSGPSAGRYPDEKENSMPSVEVSAPVSSVASDRLALGVGWVRPGAGIIGCTINPSNFNGPSTYYNSCFAGEDA